MKKKIISMVALGTVVGAVSACGSSAVDPTQIPGDLATYLYTNTPDDGIDQTMALTVTDTEVMKEEKQGDGTIVIPVTATVTDRSVYRGSYLMQYEKDTEKGGYRLIAVEYVAPEDWSIEPLSDVTEAMVRDAIIDREYIEYSGNKVPVSADNVSRVEITNKTDADDGTKTVDAVYTVETKYVDYATEATLTLTHTINGYKITGAVINDYDAELTPNYAFELSDEELIRMISDKALHVGNQGVALSDVTEINSRRDVFDATDLTMTIITNVQIEKPEYTAAADIYYTYAIDKKGEYWNLDSYHGTNFRVINWTDEIKGYYMGYVGSEGATLDIADITGSEMIGYLIGNDGSERELKGHIDYNTLAVNFRDPETDKILLEGDYSADQHAFTGQYGRRSSWTLVTAEAYRDLMGLTGNEGVPRTELERVEERIGYSEEDEALFGEIGESATEDVKYYTNT